jgi:hypothetical protein
MIVFHICFCKLPFLGFTGLVHRYIVTIIIYDQSWKKKNHSKSCFKNDRLKWLFWVTVLPWRYNVLCSNPTMPLLIYYLLWLSWMPQIIHHTFLMRFERSYWWMIGMCCLRCSIDTELHIFGINISVICAVACPFFVSYCQIHKLVNQCWSHVAWITNLYLHKM